MHVNMKLNKAVVAGKSVIALYPAYSWLVVKKTQIMEIWEEKKIKFVRFVLFHPVAKAWLESLPGQPTAA